MHIKICGEKTLLNLNINTKNLIHNALFLRSKTSAELCAVVKANAYGHGFRLVEILDDFVDSFAVSCGEEALQVKRYTDKPVYVLCPSIDVGDDNIIYCAMSEKDLFHKHICVKINSGMNRLGILPEQANDFLKLAKSRGAIVDSLYTHFSDVEYAPIQFNRFMKIKCYVKRHASASNFLALDRKYHLDMVRCGLALYGYGHSELKPVLSAFTEVYSVIDVKKGDKIGYSREAPENMKIAVLGAGYADGIRRSEQEFFVGGKRCKTVGNVCMDMCLVDVGETNVKAGDIAEYLGENIAGQTVADKNETIIYEILTSLGSRCRRIYE